MIKLTFIIALLLSGTCLRAASYDSRYEVTTRNGLSNSSVNHILQDSHGLMWISTWDGVNVYNGNSIRTYKSDPSNPSTLLDNIVWFIFQEDERFYWAVTDRGVSRLDTRTGHFKRYTLGSEHDNPMSGSTISMDMSEEGDLFFSAKDWGLAYYDRVEDLMVPFNVSGLRSYDVANIFCIGSDRLLMNLTDGSVVSVSYAILEDGTVDAAVKDILVPATESVYYSVREDAYIYFFGSHEVSRWNIAQMQFDGYIPVETMISYADEGPDGKLYGLTGRSNVYELDFEDGSVTHVPELSRNNLLSFYFGAEGVTWLAIDGVGLEVMYGIDLPMKRFDNKDVFGEKSGSVTAFVQAEDGYIYVSTLGNGVFVLDEAGEFVRRVEVAGDYGTQIFSMGSGPDGNLFLGSTGSIGVLSLKNGRSYPLISLQIVAYCQYYDTRRNRLWIGTIGDGLYCLDMDTSGEQLSVTGYKVYEHKKGDSSSLSSNNIMHLAPCGDDHLWVGTLGGGLSLLDFEEETFSSYTSEGGSPINDHVRFILPEENGSIWVGTSYGIFQGTPDGSGTMDFVSYNESDGLEDNTIHAIMKDRNGNLWLSTNGGLSMFDCSEKTFTNYNSRELLQSEEFYVHSCMTMRNGEMFFGGVAGLNHFFPEKMRLREFVPKVYIESVSVRLDRIDYAFGDRQIELKHDENFFNIAFSALEYIDNDNCEYSYKLDGFDEDWVAAGSGLATFTNVPPGNYVFRVRSTNGDKVWCDNETALNIRIRSPWWLTFWAFLLYAVLVIGGFLVYLRQKREKERQKRLLNMEVMEKQSQKERYEAKLNFFTNIAHEFGTPLTLIACSGEQLASSFSSNSKENRYIRIVNDNAARMQNLIQELLEFRKVETGFYEPRYEYVEPVKMLRRIMDNFYEMGHRHGIGTLIHVPQDEIPFISDASALEKILTNLVSNAYKYTPDGGVVDVIMESRDNGVRCVVKNTSKGLSEEKLSHVFDRFVILDTFEKQVGKGKMTRNGLGTALVNGLVKTLGGSISVDSVIDESVTFEFFLPSADEAQINVSSSDTDARDRMADMAFMELESDASEGGQDNGIQDRTRLSVLVVDDDKQICDLVADILSNRYRVMKAGDGEKAMEILEKDRPDLIITDMDMPKMGGMELLKHLKSSESTRYIPVIVLAFKTDVASEICTYDLGSEAFIQKPFLPQQLQAIVRNVLKNRISLKDYYRSSLSEMDIFQGRKMNTKEKEFILAFIRTVEDNITDELSPAIVAQKLCTSEMTLYRRVKELVGKRPSEFIRSIKLNKAADMLKTTDMTVQEIMFDCGFNNKSYFYRSFAQAYGMSPKEYRKSR